MYRGPVKPPKVGKLDQYSGTDVRCFGDLVGDIPNLGKLKPGYAEARVNFAGHFVLGACTCGSGCHYLYMWDALTGKFYPDFPFGAIFVGPYGTGEIYPYIYYTGERYRVDSRLLVVQACFGETCDCATRYYTWNGNHFKLILRRPVRMPPKCLK